MSAPGSVPNHAEEEANKKRRRENLLATSTGDERDDIVIISYMGANRAVEEMEADALAMCFTNYRMNIRNFVCVADCAAKPIFIGYTDQSKGDGRYVKKIIPSTTWLKNINCNVMILICHGSTSFTSPAYLTFCESPGVHGDGGRREVSPDAMKIWSR